MRKVLRYIELKSGYADSGPAWIAPVLFSRSGVTVYFNNKGFQRYREISGNYRDIESGEEYWISGVKKDGSDRHWAGNGKIIVDSKILKEYLALTGKNALDSAKYIVVDIPEQYPVERVGKLLNNKE